MNTAQAILERLGRAEEQVRLTLQLISDLRAGILVFPEGNYDCAEWLRITEALREMMVGTNSTTLAVLECQKHAIQDAKQEEARSLPNASIERCTEIEARLRALEQRVSNIAGQVHNSGR